MAKKGMKHPDVTRGPRNETSPVHQIQGKAKSGKEKANPIIAGTTGANQKVWHEKPISKAHGIIDTDLARDNLENDIPFADLQDLYFPFCHLKCRARQVCPAHSPFRQ